MSRTYAPRDTTSASIARDARPATEKQIAFARSLVRDRDVMPGMGATDALEWYDATLREHGMTVAQASAFIDRAKSAAFRQHATRVGGDTAPATATPGFYVRGAEAYKVQANKAGTGTYALRWSGSSWEYAPGVGRTLADLTPMTAEDAARLGLASGRCINCCRTLGGASLSAQVSAVIGYGETCAGNNGWPYPTGAAAQRAYLATA